MPILVKNGRVYSGSANGSSSNIESTIQFLKTNWTTTEVVNNKTYYIQTVNLSQTPNNYPTVGIVPISGTLPTAAEQEAFDAVDYFTVNDTTNVIKGYATTAPSETFAVVIKGV